MQQEYLDEYNENVHKAKKALECGDIKKAADYLDLNYLIIFNEYTETGNMLTDVNQRLKNDSLESQTRLSLSYLSDSLSKILTSEGNWLRYYSELQKMDKLPTNIPLE